MTELLNNSVLIGSSEGYVPPLEVRKSVELSPSPDSAEHYFQRRVQLTQTMADTWSRTLLAEQYSESSPDDKQKIERTPAFRQLFPEGIPQDISSSTLAATLLSCASRQISGLSDMSIDTVVLDVDPSVSHHGTVAELIERPHAPALENILLGLRDALDTDVAILGLSEPQFRAAYERAWVQHQDTIVITDTYEKTLEKICRVFEQSNDRRVGRSLLYGPPGTGKTALYKEINSRQGKDTYVISGRPHLGYAELVAAPELIPSSGQEKSTSTYVQLFEAYSHLDAPGVAQRIWEISKKQAEVDFPTDATHIHVDIDQARREFQSHYLETIGLDTKTIQTLLDVKNVDDFHKKSDVSTLIQAHGESMKKSFLNHLLGMTDKSLLPDSQEQVRYLEGLIIIADKLGMNVVIDEAEKMMGDTQNKSFAGLEELLVKCPGKEKDGVQIGDRKHVFSANFAVDLTLNELTIPAHILSRFGIRTLRLEPTVSDVIGIALKKFSHPDGTFTIPPIEEEKIAFFLSYVWPVLEGTQKYNGKPWDLRTLTGLLGSISHKGELRTKVSAALTTILTEESAIKVLAQFPGLLPKTKLHASEKVTTDENPLGSALLALQMQRPFYDNSLLRSMSVPLTLEQVETVIAHTASTHKQKPDGMIVLPHMTINIVPRTGSGSNDDIEYRTQTRDELLTVVRSPVVHDKNESASLIGSDLWGKYLLVQHGKRFSLVDTSVVSFDPKTKESTVKPQIIKEVEAPVSIAITSDGSVFSWISSETKNPTCFFQSTKVLLDKNGSTLPQQPISFVLSEEWDMKSIEFTDDGVFGILRVDSKKTKEAAVHVWKVQQSIAAHSPMFLFEEPEKGNWTVISSKGVALMVDRNTKTGYRIA